MSLARLSFVLHDLADLSFINSVGLGVRVNAHQELEAAMQAQPDRIRAVDLTRWMVASCAAGAVDDVNEILPMLDDALAKFDAWWSTQALTAPSKKP